MRLEPIAGVGYTGLLWDATTMPGTPSAATWSSTFCTVSWFAMPMTLGSDPRAPNLSRYRRSMGASSRREATLSLG